MWFWMTPCAWKSLQLFKNLSKTILARIRSHMNQKAAWPVIWTEELKLTERWLFSQESCEMITRHWTVEKKSSEYQAKITGHG